MLRKQDLTIVDRIIIKRSIKKNDKMQQITKDEAMKVADSLRGISNQELALPVQGFPEEIAVSKLIDEVENLTEIGQAFIVDWKNSTDRYNKIN